MLLIFVGGGGGGGGVFSKRVDEIFCTNPLIELRLLWVRLFKTPGGAKILVPKETANNMEIF